MKKFSTIILAVFLLTVSFTEAKRSLGSRGSSSRPSGNTNRRVYTTRAPSHTQHSYGSNSQQNRVTHSSVNHNTPRPVGPPPAYSPHNTPGGAPTNVHAQPPSYAAPPSYAGNQHTRPAATSRPLPSNNYPHGGLPASNVAPPKYYSPQNAPSLGYHPAGSIPASGGYHPSGGYHAPTYYPAGSMGAGYHPPPQAPPIYAGSGVSAGYYPAGSFPQKSSGPGFGTGLLAGAVGGAVVGHLLTPSHSSYGGGGNYGNSGTAGQDRVIIINNTPGQASEVSTSNGNQPIVVNNSPQPAPAPANPPAGQPAVQEPPVPLAPFQPGSTQVQNQPAVAPPLIHQPTNAATNQTYPDGTVPLAPTQAPPPSGGVMCVPVKVNVTSETDPTNITTVEQIACYEVPAGFDPNAPQQQTANPYAPQNPYSQQPDLMKMPGETPITQRTSTATLAESSQIKQSGAIKYFTYWSTVTSTLAALMVAYILQ